MNMKIRDGWHCIAGHDVYVDNGFIVRGTKDNGQLPAYVYRWCKDSWVHEYKITPDAFRSGVKRGTIILT